MEGHVLTVEFFLLRLVPWVVVVGCPDHPVGHFDNFNQRVTETQRETPRDSKTEPQRETKRKRC